MLYLSESIRDLIKIFNDFDYFLINKCKDTEKCYVHSSTHKIVVSPIYDLARSKDIKRLFLQEYVNSSKIILTSVYEYFEEYFIVRESMNTFPYEIALFRYEKDMLKFKLSEDAQEWEWCEDCYSKK